MEVDNINSLYNSVREIITAAKSLVRTTVNFVTIDQNWEIGKMIVEEEQGGKEKADYGKYIIHDLSKKLTAEFGYTIQHLKFCRQFYNTFPIGYAMQSQTKNPDNQYNAISYAVRNQSVTDIRNAMRTNTHPLFNIISANLTWTQYRLFF